MPGLLPFLLASDPSLGRNVVGGRGGAERAAPGTVTSIFLPGPDIGGGIGAPDGFAGALLGIAGVASAS